ncbi:transcriptional regulator, GntR family [Thalassoporum mexicanum PCC 7367]|uniref:GntR family transcriptional regulator n=1 Tax=Thalassoporum mexicanum TaxID=3457544 RepID=UPI00029F808A|nr:transcriptional regulator, GntR family [Pseudanabaena sp. PCC 7367]
MVKFSIQLDSEIPASTQLFDQINFAITSRQLPPGHQLPSTRQLAQWTGLHRNTISKVYQQLKQVGLVEAKGGSGIYVSSVSRSGGESEGENSAAETLQQLVRQSLDRMLGMGCTLEQSRELFDAEIDWRLSCNAQLLVTAGREDFGLAVIMSRELEKALSIPIQTVAVEELDKVIAHTSAGTIVTNRYFLDRVQKIVGDRQIRVIAVDIYDYSDEIDRIKALPKGSYIGLVSISTGILRLAESLISSLRGDEVLVVTVLPQDTYRLQSIVRSADLVITGNSGENEVKEAIALTKKDRIRPLDVLYSKNHIATQSVESLKLELGLTV